MIEVISLSKKYGNFLAVDDVSFCAYPGSVTGLLGPNGAGKTTILKTLCGLHYPTKGSVQIEGLEVADFPVAVKSLVGYVSELPALIPNITPKEFLTYIYEVYAAGGMGKNKELFKRENKKHAVERVVENCGLNDVLYKPIGSLSKGYRQRLSFAQALIHDPAVLILDEPMSGLDPAQINQMRTLIKEVSKAKTVLLSTHLMQEVEALCNIVHVISKGKLVASGTAEQIRQSVKAPSFEKAFLLLTDDSQTTGGETAGAGAKTLKETV